MSKLAYALGALAVLLVLAAVGFALAAIWVIGPDSGRSAGTAFVLVVLAFIVGGASAELMDRADQ